MTFEQIKKTIEEDYNNVAQAKLMRTRGGMKTFYLAFSEALEELHKSVSPFITDKEQFIEHIKYIKDIVAPEVYENILSYCHDKLKLDIT